MEMWVGEAAVIGLTDPRWGEVGKAIVALKSGHSATEAELIEHCRSRLARYQVPKVVEFRAELPKSSAGKILKRQLKER